MSGSGGTARKSPTARGLRTKLRNTRVKTARKRALTQVVNVKKSAAKKAPRAKTARKRG